MSSEINIQKHKHREITLDSDLKEKKTFDTVPLTWEEIENHAHVKAVGKLADAKDGDEVVSAIEEIFDHSRPQEVLRVETDLKVEVNEFDEVDFENNRRIRARADKELVNRSADVQIIKATTLIHKALAAAGSLTIPKMRPKPGEPDVLIEDPQYEQERLNHHRTVERLLEVITDESTSPLLFTAADMSLEHITLDRVGKYPEVLPELYSYATMLYGVQNSDNYIREDDGENNQQHAVWLMKQVVANAEHAHKFGKIDDQLVVDALASKYEMIYAVERKAADGNEEVAYEAVMEEQQRDNQSPLLRDANKIRREEKINLMVQMRQNMLNEHPAVVSPIISTKLAF